MEDVAEGNPKACCERLENMLAESFQYEQLPPDVPLLPDLKLQPLHHLSLNAYIALSSAYRIRANNMLPLDAGNQDNELEAFELSRAAAAYALLLAGATHHLFSFDSSLIASAAHFWVSAGKTLLSYLGSPTWISSLGQCNSSSECMPLDNLKQDTDSYHSLHAKEEGALSWHRFDATCRGFTNCISRISANVWPYLIHRLPCLKDIKSPVDFRWLGITDTRRTGETPSEEVCQHRLEAGKSIEGEEQRCVFQLATHSLLYGRYLASICYGPHFSLTD